MFKWTVETKPSLLPDKQVQIDTYFTINGEKTFRITEIVLDDMCKDKELFNRMIDRQLYELRKQVKKYLAITD